MTGPGIRIHYRRSGGIAGVDLIADAGSEELPAEHVQLARQLLADAGPSTPAPAGAADHFSYQLELDDGSRRRSFTWSESGVPDHVRPLLTAMHERATPTRSR